MITLGFIVYSALLGLGLAMDAFSVSLANGLNEPKIKWERMNLIALVFAVFQALMPLIGWICVHTIATYFKAFEKCIPYIALVLLLYIGGKMIIEGVKGDEEDTENKRLTLSELMIQGVATSIDALSVGFTIASYNFFMASVCNLIIAIVTYVTCILGVILGKKFGTKLAGKANILGGVILVAIGLEIFITGVF